MSIIEKAMEKASQQTPDKSNQNIIQTLNNLDASHTPPTIKNDEDLDSLVIAEPRNEDSHTVLRVEKSTTDEAPLTIAQSASEPVHATTRNENLHGQEKSLQITETEQRTGTENGAEKPNASIKINPIPELIMAGENALVEGGSYRILKEYIISLRKSQPDKSLFMVTSPMKGEGKTLVSCNLACALATEFDTTVLLIDIDLRAPMCHNVLGIENPPKGLSDCLLHNTPIADCLIQTGIGKLSLLCAGSLIDNPAELITSKRMQNFLQEIKHRYPDRIVILDSLPLLPFAESRALSRMTDGVMLVVRENTTYKRHLESALQQLQDVPLLGMIYNSATTAGADKEIYNLANYSYAYTNPK